MTTYLLDINLLLALSDPMHIHHEPAHHWFATVGQSSWATCPLTENGFVCIASHSKYPNRPGDSPFVLNLLRQFCSAGNHQFWADEVTLRQIIVPGAVFTHNQITDLYLLALAVSHGGKLATLDQRIPAVVVRGGEKALALINA